MKIRLTSIFVDDQQRAFEFYTGVLGFELKFDEPVGEHRWLTVTAPDEPDGPELLLEPNAHPAAETYQTALFGDGIAAAAFSVESVRAEYERLTALGVSFSIPPTQSGGSTIAVFDDTCGNLIQIYESPDA